MLVPAVRSNAFPALRVDGAREPTRCRNLEVPMTTLARAFTHVTGIQIDVETLEPVVIFSGIGIVLSLVLSLISIKAYGLDPSAGFF
jgi:hypothetical protein